MHITTIESQEGSFTACFSKHGLTRLEFPSSLPRATAEGRSNGKASSSELARWKKLTTNALQAALAGKTPAQLPPLDLSSGTEFQQTVWAALRQIPVGKTTTYAQVSLQIQKPLATRAVGSACGANPIPVLIPCHRVLPKGGGLGGFSGGLHWKERLLGRERCE